MAPLAGVSLTYLFGVGLLLLVAVFLLAVMMVRTRVLINAHHIHSLSHCKC